MQVKKVKRTDDDFADMNYDGGEYAEVCGHEYWKNSISPKERFQFITKVYTLLCVQLLGTACFAGYCMYVKQGLINYSKNPKANTKPDLAFWNMLRNPAYAGVFLGLYITSVISMFCCRLDRMAGVNYALLGVLTLSISWFVGLACVRVKSPAIVAEAAFLTFALVFALTLWAATTDEDPAMHAPFVFVIVILGLVSVLLGFIYGYNMHLLYCFIGIFLFSFFIVWDTYEIFGMGSDEQRRGHGMIGPDDAILASVILYLDIIQLFLYILDALSGSD